MVRKPVRIVIRGLVATALRSDHRDMLIIASPTIDGLRRAFAKFESAGQFDPELCGPCEIIKVAPPARRNRKRKT